MCLIVFAIGAHPRYPLVLLANRDEVYGRPAASARRWEGAAHIFGGRDLDKGGTWLAVAFGAKRRIAAVTNVRHPGARREGLSRGALVRAALDDGGLPNDGAFGAYPAFNLLAGDETGIDYLTEDGTRARISSGVHGLSNDRLDVPWPKVARATGMLAAALEGDDIDPEAAFAILSDRAEAPNDALPETGVPKDLERALSATFIAMPGYGTRASSLVLFRRDGRIRFVERSFGEGGAPLGEVDAVL